MNKTTWSDYNSIPDRETGFRVPPRVIQYLETLAPSEAGHTPHLRKATHASSERDSKPGSLLQQPKRERNQGSADGKHM
jgi:hypothetical protein